MCDAFEFPRACTTYKTINDIIDRTEQHHDVYYYTDKSKYYSLLDERMTDKEVIYRIDDWGVAREKWKMCLTLKPKCVHIPIECQLSEMLLVFAN